MGQSENEILEPRRGTKAWIDAQGTVEVDGLLVPACHRIPIGGSILRGEDDGRCKIIIPDRGRCRAPRVRGLLGCSAHMGGGDPAAASILGNRSKARLKARRSLLGIGANRIANPRQMARLAAQERAEEIAKALVDGPLDDTDLATIERQLAVIRALDATYPLQSMSVEVELPTNGEGVLGMGWQDMQQLASRLLEPLGQTGADALEPSKNTGFQLEQ
jgi:hypothetical protein